MKGIRWVQDFTWDEDLNGEEDVINGVRFELNPGKIVPIEITDDGVPKYYGEDISGIGSRVGLILSMEVEPIATFATDADSWYEDEMIKSDAQSYGPGWDGARLALANRTEWSWCEGWVKNPTYVAIIVEDDCPEEWVELVQRHVNLPVVKFPARMR